MLWGLAIFSSQLWGYSHTTEHSYHYDAVGNYVIERNAESEAHKLGYDDTPSAQRCCNNSLSSGLQAKALGEYFFVLLGDFIVTDR